MWATVTDLTNNYKYHPPKTQAVAESHEDVRAQAYSLARHLNEILPESREKSIALTKIEEAMMWANAAIARNQ